MSYNPKSIKYILYSDSSEFFWRFIWRPILIFQSLFYIYSLLKYFSHPAYLITNSHYYNHVGHISLVYHTPNHYLIGIHLFMALFWTLGILIQKSMINFMSTSNDKDYNIYRRIHIICGISLSIISIIGCIAGQIIGFTTYKYQPIRYFLTFLPLYLVPSIILTGYYAYKKDIINHRFFATITFISTALGAFFTPPLIWLLGNYTFLSPELSELIATILALLITLLYVVFPAMNMKTIHKIEQYYNYKLD